MVFCWRRNKRSARELTEMERADRRHRRGWFSYAFASEAFVVVAMTLFMPVALEQYARDNGRATPDLVTPCNDSTVDSDTGCKVYLGGRWTDTTSFSLYVSAASMGLQAISVISMSALADRPYYRKAILLGFGWLGALATIVYIALPSSSGAWPLAMPLTVIANVGYGSSFVALNAYLPGIAARDPSVLAAAEAEGKQQSPSASVEPKGEGLAPGDINAPSVPPTAADEEKALDSPIEKDAPVLASMNKSQEYNKALSSAIARTSSYGIAIGYSASMVLLILTVIPVLLLEGSTLSLRIAVTMSGVWWAMGSIMTVLWLRTGDRGDRPHIARELVRSWVQILGMLRPAEIRKMANTFKFLAAWFVLSDGFTTITATAILFARTKLHMPSTSLIILGALGPLGGIIGSLVWPIIQRKIGWSTRSMIMLIASLASLLLLYGSIGIALAKHDIKGGGLTVPGEMYGAAVYFGLLNGGFQSFARALYGEIIPPNEEARWYALYSITDKSSSFIGPLIIGSLADATGDIRWGFLFLLGMVLAALPVILTVDIRKGREDARKYVRLI